MELFVQDHILELQRCGALSHNLNAFQVGVRDDNRICVYFDPTTGSYVLDRDSSKNRAYTGRLRTQDAAVSEDNIRRDFFLRSQIANKTWMDVGCGNGGIIHRLRHVAKKIYGVDFSNAIDKAAHAQWPSSVELLIGVISSTGEAPSEPLYSILEDSLDVLTMFHVLEHMSEPYSSLINYSVFMKTGAKIIIEVPNANDFLIKNSEEFRQHTFWSEHLVTYSEDSLIQLLDFAGFTNIKIRHVQRYGLDNHMKWLATGLRRVPLDYNPFPFMGALNSKYGKLLCDQKQSDTLIATACSP